MIIAVVFLWLLALAAALYMARHDLAQKPWLEQGGAISSADAREPTGATGLVLVLAVAGVLFALVSSAFLMRAGDADWVMPPAPPLLWFNTGLLVVSSFSLEGAARFSARDARRAQALLALGALAACGFLVAQIVAWREMAAAGFGVGSNVGAAFFYLMTGLHGAHVLGGLVALAITVLHARGEMFSARPRIKFCAMYWHFLLLIWLFLFALLQGWGGGLVALCRALI